LDLETALPFHLPRFGKEREREKNEECGFEVRECSDPIDSFRVNGMNREEQRPDPGNAPVVEELARCFENEKDNQNVYENAEKVETEGERPEDLPENQKAERHDRAIVICRPSLANEGPYRGPKDLRQVMPALYVRILQDLLIIVIYESVDQRISIAKKGDENEQQNEQLVRKEPRRMRLLRRGISALTRRKRSR
jgi:hypothetical protein